MCKERKIIPRITHIYTVQYCNRKYEYYFLLQNYVYVRSFLNLNL